MRSSEEVSDAQKRLRLGMLVSFMALCAKHVRRVSKKLKAVKSSSSDSAGSPRFHFSALPAKSPLRAPVRTKQLVASISNKAIAFVHRRKKGEGSGEEEFGDGGVWQRAILMGDKCQPLDFSGTIYYDSSGKRLDSVPVRSPRASPLPGYLARKADTGELRS